jgi:hypothetical protein
MSSEECTSSFEGIQEKLRFAIDALSSRNSTEKVEGQAQSASRQDLVACCWEVLTRKYSEDHRYYHTMMHLSDLFGFLDQGCNWYHSQQQGKPAANDMQVS